jgi:hypothetical protein
MKRPRGAFFFTFDFMIEAYLHYLWKTKNLPLHLMKLNDGRNFNVVDFGKYNPVESGPDFFNARIVIDGIIWCGNVELHVKSSDWYRHNHHKDPAYDNVILHVVYTSDKVVVQNGNPIPEIGIKEFVDLNHYLRFKEHYRFKNIWNCSSMLELVPKEILNQHVNNFLLRRLKRKNDEVIENFNFMNHRSVFCFLLAKSFGMKVNQLPFEMLVRKLEDVDFSNLNDEERIIKIQLMSGYILPETVKEKMIYQNLLRKNMCLPSSIWKNGGSRPNNQSKKRIWQFANLYNHLTKIEDEEWKLIVENNLFSSYISEKIFSLKFIGHLLINSVAYFYFWLAERTGNLKYKEYVVQILESQPAEVNRITKFWSTSKNYLRNASQSQAFLEIFNELCSNKLCLNCDIGKYLIRDENNSEDNILL